MSIRFLKKAVTAAVPMDPLHLMKRGEVARLLNLSMVRIDQLAARGVLRKVTLPGLSRASGFCEGEVRELLVRRQEGGAA